MGDEGPSSGKGMDWMYKGPSALVDREDYLLGRKVDKSLQLLEAQEKGDGEFSYADEVEKDLTPASIFSHRSNVAPVDIIRKIKEDPLYQIEKKEQETRKELLQNPIRLKQLRKLAEQKQAAEKSSKSHHKKKHKKRRSSSSSSDSYLGKLNKSDIDRLLAAKLNELKKKSKKRNSSSTSSSSSSSNEDDNKKYKSKSSGSSGRHRRHSPVVERSDKNYKGSRYEGQRDSGSSARMDRHDRSRDYNKTNEDRRHSKYEDRKSRQDSSRRSRSRSPRRYSDKKEREGASTSRSNPSYTKKPSQTKEKMSEEEMERRRREMMDNAKVRDEDRRNNVERWKEEQRKEDEEQAKQHKTDFIRQHLLSAAESSSVEKRIKSNSYNLQKSSGSMSQNFARK